MTGTVIILLPRCDDFSSYEHSLRGPLYQTRDKAYSLAARFKSSMLSGRLSKQLLRNKPPFLTESKCNLNWACNSKSKPWNSWARTKQSLLSKMFAAESQVFSSDRATLTLPASLITEICLRHHFLCLILGMYQHSNLRGPTNIWEHSMFRIIFIWSKCPPSKVLVREVSLWWKALADNFYFPSCYQMAFEMKRSYSNEVNLYVSQNIESVWQNFDRASDWE